MLRDEHLPAVDGRFGMCMDTHREDRYCGDHGGDEKQEEQRPQEMLAITVAEGKSQKVSNRCRKEHDNRNRNRMNDSGIFGR